MAEFGMTPPSLAEIKSMIPLDVSTINNKDNKELTNNGNDKLTESNPYISLKLKYPEVTIFPPVDNMNRRDYDNHENNELLTDRTTMIQIECFND